VRSPNEDTRFHFELLAHISYTGALVEELITNPAADAKDWPACCVSA
jgi:hypothetical protein